MNEKKLGQDPAFPGVEAIGDNKIIPFNGMDKRFYAACAAMQGIMAGRNITFDSLHPRRVIEFSYKLADELLKQENE